MTNADRIRNMTDEELAVLLEKIVASNGDCLFNCNEYTSAMCIDCKQCYLNWLQKEVQE